MHVGRAVQAACAALRDGDQAGVAAAAAAQAARLGEPSAAEAASLAADICAGLRLHGPGPARDALLELADALMASSAPAARAASEALMSGDEAAQAAIVESVSGDAASASPAAARVAAEALGWCAQRASVKLLFPPMPLLRRLMEPAALERVDRSLQAALQDPAAPGATAAIAAAAVHMNSLPDLPQGEAAEVAARISAALLGKAALQRLVTALEAGDERPSLLAKGAFAAAQYATTALVTALRSADEAAVDHALLGAKPLILAAGRVAAHRVEASRAAGKRSPAEGAFHAPPVSGDGAASGLHALHDDDVGALAYAPSMLLHMATMGRGREQQRDMELAAAVLAVGAMPVAPRVFGPRADNPTSPPGIIPVSHALGPLGILANANGAYADRAADVAASPLAGAGVAGLARAHERFAAMMVASAPGYDGSGGQLEALLRPLLEGSETLEELLDAVRPGSLDTRALPDGLALNASAVTLATILIAGEAACAEAAASGAAASFARTSLVALLPCSGWKPASPKHDRMTEAWLKGMMEMLKAHPAAVAADPSVPAAFTAMAGAAIANQYAEASEQFLGDVVDCLATLDTHAGSHAVADAAHLFAATLGRAAEQPRKAGDAATVASLRWLMGHLRLLLERGGEAAASPGLFAALLDAQVPRAAVAVLSAVDYSDCEKAVLSSAPLLLLALGTACLQQPAGGSSAAAAAAEAQASWLRGALRPTAELRGAAGSATADADADGAGAGGGSGGSGSGSSSGSSSGTAAPEAVARAVLTLFRTHDLANPADLMGAWAFGHVCGWLAAAAELDEGALVRPVLAHGGLLARLTTVPTRDFQSAKAVVPGSAAHLLSVASESTPAVGAAVAEHTAVESMLLPLAAALAGDDADLGGSAATERARASAQEAGQFLRMMAPFTTRMLVAVQRHGAPTAMASHVLRANRQPLLTLLGNNERGIASACRRLAGPDGAVDSDLARVVQASVELLEGLAEDEELAMELVGGGFPELLDDVASLFESAEQWPLRPHAFAQLSPTYCKTPGALAGGFSRADFAATAARARALSQRLDEV